MPSHVNGSGASTILTKTPGIFVPQASVTTGKVGTTASARHSTVAAPSAGTTGANVLLIV